MNSLIEDGTLSELPCGANFSYILSDNSCFLPTEYKVLQSQGNSCFVRCVKMTYNGKIQLYYMSGALRTFSSMLPSMGADNFLTVVSNLFRDVIDANNNGFLSCQNIDISFDKVFVDPATFKVHLIYLPLSKKQFPDNAAFENELRTGLVKLIYSNPSIASPRVMRFCADLSNGRLSMEQLLDQMRSDTASIFQEGMRPMHIVAINSPISLDIAISKNEFVIGKNADKVDGCISFNPAISRIHCKITSNGGKYYITDMNSANGTFINRKRIAVGQPHQLENGDIIRLANSDFKAVIQ